MGLAVVLAACVGCGGSVSPGDEWEGSSSPQASAVFQGEYFATLAMSLTPNTPLVLSVNAIMSEQADGTHVMMSFQPLVALDRTTPVGQPVQVDSLLANDDTFVTEPFDLHLQEPAHPFGSSMLELQDIIFTGSITPNGELACGEVDGLLEKPIITPLQGSTFTMEQVSGPLGYPEPPMINCAGDLALPL